MKNNFLKTFILSVFLMVFQVALAQDSIKGTVSDDDGQPIPGATIVLKGTSTATTADFDGNFSINVGLGDILVVSYVGYSSAEVTVDSSTLSVTLQSATKLDEVIVTSYGETSKKKSAASTQRITSETIENRPNASVIQTLTGQVAGLDIFTNSGQPGANSLIELRGSNSINGNTEPLILLDGTPIDEDEFSQLNPNEIESLDVLKDAGGTAIYGNRGANGVILIKTKRGEFNSPLKIKVNSSYAVSQYQDSDYDMMNASELLALEKELNRGYGASLTDEEIANFGPGYDWKDFFYRDGKTQNHNITITSGGSKSSQLTSLGYYEQEGVTITTKLQRFNLRNNFNSRSDDGKFNLASSLSLNFAKTNIRGSEGSSGINRNIQFGPLYAAPYVLPSDYIDDVSAFGADKGFNVFQITPLILMDLAEKNCQQG
jgi:TonB-linked SusC/RagA family outer membrane protein